MVFELPDEAAKARYLRYRNWSPYIVTPIAMVSLAVARTASLAPPWLQVALALALPLLGWLALRASIGFAPRVPDHFWPPVAIHIPPEKARRGFLSIGALLSLLLLAAVLSFRKDGPTAHGGWVLTMLLVFFVALILGIWRDNRAARRRP
ncbi:hypothetical protein HMPREF9946_03494 [Acetobacteraceae bacterium AT-5844]|nr:hypothetical protein HMPREF9946_03494 [Acetobacteraceae bacterium AT-5844]